MEAQEELRRQMQREVAAERGGGSARRREPLLGGRQPPAYPAALLEGGYGNGRPEVERVRPRLRRSNAQAEAEAEADAGTPPPVEAALRALLHAYGMDFPNFRSKGQFEGFGPYFVDNVVEFDSARRYGDPTQTVLDGRLQFQVGDFVNDLNTSAALFNLTQMELTPFYIPLCGNEKIVRWGVVQVLVEEFLTESATRNREQRGNFHWELAAEVVGPRIRLTPNQRIMTFRVPMKRVDDVLTFAFRTPSGPVVFCNEFAPGGSVRYDGADTFQALQAGVGVNTGFGVGEIAALERRSMPAGQNSSGALWLPFHVIEGTDRQGMAILATPSGSEIRVDPSDVDAAVLPPVASADWRLHNLSREVLIPVKFRSMRAEPTQYLIATSR